MVPRSLFLPFIIVQLISSRSPSGVSVSTHQLDTTHVRVYKTYLIVPFDPSHCEKCSG